ncbi:MAG: type VI secretion system tube protein Hcp [Desulfuromonadales bacterium]|nr:MAG: type VI secretion system tube protein Hcp [Desulfuromonadales bacterium]
MALDVFIKIDGIKGESTDDKHKDEIDVLAWSWGMSQSGTTGTGGGGGAGKVSFKNLTITKRTDRASPSLMLACSNGKHIKEATLTVRKPAEVSLEFVRLKLSDIIVSSLDDCTCGDESFITEQVTLNFSKVQFEYFRQKPDGSPEPVPPFKWDIKANKPG